jgi:nucleoid-associated protein YgaU
MGSVAQAVLEFDEAVQVPWRPRLASPRADVPVPPSRPAPAATVSHRARPHAVPVGRCAAPAALRAAARVAAPAPAVATRGCPHCAGTAAVPLSALRLTRRARGLLALVAVVVVVAVGAWVGSSAGSPGEDLRLVGESSVIVRPGDTLWSIARSVAGDADVRAVVDELQSLNGLQDSAIAPGQVLLLP